MYGMDMQVRKEKLGDRITALQQLVSPFGKTDTASVLHEAIEYIKFLHDQVNVLSTPYMKNGSPIQHQQGCDNVPKESEGKKQDLRSQGLCLVPISSTFPMANETPVDFWMPTFGGPLFGR
ncbi:transcription factor bHLH112-like [Trifolium medium]|uniref:Transcription factor bHLH112-like n=1 Tax=Trifolium medium TaxID=97028 RepID=A0A392MNV3_9FABA|nr:transcription factor bHLH112-like [Trifolium medium]